MLHKVLVVDDDEIIHLISKRMIGVTNFSRVTEFLFNGKECINYFDNLLNSKMKKEDIPELIFLDINMPIMDGWAFLNEFSRNYSAHFPETKIVMLTSSSDAMDVEKSKKYPNVIEYITKPLTSEKLEQIAKKMNKK